jgi:hypothetical protein
MGVFCKLTEVAMVPLLLDDVSFWDVVWWMIMLFFFTMAIWIFIAIVADIFRRNDISGWIKAIWLFGIFVFPFLGALAYMIFRPVTQQDRDMAAAYQAQMQRAAGYSAADEIAKAQQLKDSGAISAEEFEAMKKRALA